MGLLKNIYTKAKDTSKGITSPPPTPKKSSSSKRSSNSSRKTKSTPPPVEFTPPPPPDNTVYDLIDNTAPTGVSKDTWTAIKESEYTPVKTETKHYDVKTETQPNIPTPEPVKQDNTIISYKEFQDIKHAGLTEGQNITEYAKTHAVFTVDDKEKSWVDIKEEQPALYLHETPKGISYGYDYIRWQKEHRTPESMWSAKFLGGIANPEYIVATVGHGDFKKGESIVAKWDYETTQKIKSGNILGATFNVPAVQNIVLPYVGGSVFNLASRGGGQVVNIFKDLGFKKTSTALTLVGKAGKTGMVVLAGTTVGTDLVSTAVKEPEKFVEKSLTYGTQFTSFKAGHDFMQELKFPEIKKHVSVDFNKKSVKLQHYIEVDGKQYKFTTKTIVDNKPLTDFTLPSKPSIVPKSQWGDIIPYKYRKTIVDNKPLTDFTLPSKPSIVPKSQWGDIIPYKYRKTIVDNKPLTDYKLPIQKISISKWQPQTDSKIIIRPFGQSKPIKLGQYDTPYKSILDFPKIFESGRHITDVAVTKKITKYDFAKEFRIIEKSLEKKPSVSQGQKYKTVQILEPPKLETKKIVKLKLKQETKMETRTDSLMKQEVKTAKISIRHPSYKLKKAQIPGLKTKYMTGLVFADAQKKKMKVDTAFAQVQIPEYMQKTDTIMDTVTDSLYDTITKQTNAQISSTELLSATLNMPKLKTKMKEEQVTKIKKILPFMPGVPFWETEEKKIKTRNILEVNPLRTVKHRETLIPNPFDIKVKIKGLKM